MPNNNLWLVFIYLHNLHLNRKVFFSWWMFWWTIFPSSSRRPVCPLKFWCNLCIFIHLYYNTYISLSFSFYLDCGMMTKDVFCSSLALSSAIIVAQRTGRHRRFNIFCEVLCVRNCSQLPVCFPGVGWWRRHEGRSVVRKHRRQDPLVWAGRSAGHRVHGSHHTGTRLKQWVRQNKSTWISWNSRI